MVMSNPRVFQDLQLPRVKASRSGTYRMLDDMRKELRTRKTVFSGVSHQRHVGHTSSLTYQPGNGTTYRLITADLSSHHGAYAPGSVMVFVQNFGRGFVTSSVNDGVLHWAEVQEALGCSVFDAVVLGELLGELLQRPCVTVDEFLRERSG